MFLSHLLDYYYLFVMQNIYNVQKEKAEKNWYCFSLFSVNISKIRFAIILQGNIFQ